MQSEPLGPLRVAILARHAEQRTKLARLVLAAGHTVVDSSQAQVALVQDEAESTQLPSVVLGATHRTHAGHLSEQATPIELDAALRAVALGLTVHDPRLDSRAFEELTEHGASVLLTPRELDVLTAIGDGLSNKAVARKLGISLHTVKFHVESLFRKLGARTRAEAVARGLERRKAEVVEV